MQIQLLICQLTEQLFFMTTWHQKQNPAPLWHETLWTVMYDSPDVQVSVSRFKDPISAQRECETANRKKPGSAYVLPPSKK